MRAILGANLTVQLTGSAHAREELRQPIRLMSYCDDCFPFDWLHFARPSLGCCEARSGADCGARRPLPLVVWTFDVSTV